MPSDNPVVSLLDAAKKSIDSLVTDTTTDDGTKGDLLEELKEYIDEQQELLGEDEDEEDEDEEEDDDDED